MGNFKSAIHYIKGKCYLYILQMKRKRSPIQQESRSRPFQLRVELLNECLSLTLKYNTEFGFTPTDLSLYRHAETIQSSNDLALFVKKVGESIASRQELTSI
jgi:hypothetical protein